jgi:serine protease AprX
MTSPLCPRKALRRKAVWGPKRTLTAIVLAAFGLSTPALAASGKGSGSHSNSGNEHRNQGTKARPAAPNSFVKNYKIDDEIKRRSSGSSNRTIRVIVTVQPGAQLPSELRRYAKGGKLDIINGQVLELPYGVVRQFEKHPDIFRIHYDRPAGKENYRTSVTVGASSIRALYGYTGAGVGVAVIDSGIAAWHDDLTGNNIGLLSTVFPYGNQRVTKFVDFVAGRTLPYDDNGHGSHVAGIIAGNGEDSLLGTKQGIAPDAKLVVLKVLDANGVGTISNIIAALNWVALNHQKYNIRVVNMSVGARITESYWTDPLTRATKVLVDKGIVVVGASGNFGRNAQGQLQYGGITAPSNAPWVLTVGASSTQGTLTRSDDVMAGYSSAGPTYIDFAAKPDLVAPGTGTVSLAAPGSTFYVTKFASLVSGYGVGFKPYLALSGTSMAAPVVSGTVALMFQANPNLTPNLVKAILQYTAQPYPGYDALRQGAGFVNSLGAVRLAKFYAANQPGSRMPVQGVWSQQILWGSHRITGGYINPKGSAWATGVVWGTAHALNGVDNIVWGTECGTGCDNIVWGTQDANGDNIVWGTDGNDNIVWGTQGDDNIVWGTAFDGDNIVWGTMGDDNIVWGTDCGGADCDNIVWGTTDSDNIVWGTADYADNIVWGTNFDNIVWGTSSEHDVTWGSSGEDQEVFPDNDASEPLPDPAVEFGELPEGGL